MKPTLLFLTCANEQEANVIAHALVQQKHVACVKQSVVKSTFFWQDSVQNSEEVLLVMDSVEEKFADIAPVVNELRSYDQPVLVDTSVQQTTPGVKQWLEDTLG